MVDCFLKIEGIEGETKDSKHPNEILVESFGFGATQEGSAAIGKGMGVGRVNMQDIHCTGPISKASPALMLGCATGEHYKKATLVCRKAGKDQQEYLIITMTDVLISSYNLAGSTGGLPTDSFSLNYTKIEFEYKEQKEDGTLAGKVKKSWDVKTNKGG